MDDSFLYHPPASALPLWPGTPPGFIPGAGAPPTLAPYLAGGPGPAPAVVVLPGGGYGMKAAHEAIPVAQWLNSLGISAFVVDYRVAPYRHPIPLLDARRAIQLVRSKASEWSIDPQRVGILGFSAGGHLASTTGTHFEAFAGLDLPADDASRFSFRPNALVLCYPVISFGDCGHMGSMENLLGANPPADQRRHLSNELQVSPETPPAFLWHTADDEAVPVENSLRFASALAANGVAYDLHVFAHGSHGVGLAQDHQYAAPWTDLCARWLANLGFRN